MKVFFRNIHLYLSLAAGIVILIACFTGAILVFEKELQETFSPERYFAKPAGQRLSSDVLIANVKAEYPEGKIGSLKSYTDPNRTVEISVSIPEAPKAESLAKPATEAKTGKE